MAFCTENGECFAVGHRQCRSTRSLLSTIRGHSILMWKHFQRVPHTTMSAATQIPSQDTIDELHQAQQNDTTTKILAEALKHPSECLSGKNWKSPPLSRYRELWPQLTVVDGIMCRRYSPELTIDNITVPIVPATLRKAVLIRNHDMPSAGNQGVEQTLDRVQKGYWVNMAKDVECHCCECTKCQEAKLSV